MLIALSSVRHWVAVPLRISNAKLTFGVVLTRLTIHRRISFFNADRGDLLGSIFSFPQPRDTTYTPQSGDLLRDADGRSIDGADADVLGRRRLISSSSFSNAKHDKCKVRLAGARCAAGAELAELAGGSTFEDG
jgi:hypothetical protein